MPSPTIDFRTIRSHYGSQNGGFEELVCQLAALDTPTGLPFFRKGVGADAGLECYRVERDGKETGWQAKYFFALGASEAGQLKESFDNAVSKHPELGRFIVCVPFDLSDGRVTGRKSERDRWNDWLAARQAEIAPRVIDIQFLGSFQLIERLSRNDPPYVGRRTYWFDLPHFGSDWFRDRFDIARAALGRRYSPELNVDLPIRQTLSAFARDPDFVRRLEAWADELDEARHRSIREIATALGSDHSDKLTILSNQTAAITAAMRAAPRGPTDPLPFEDWRALISAASESLDRCWMVVWEGRRQPGDDNSITRSGLHFADHLRDALNRIFEAISAPGLNLANVRRLILCGEAGVGKSHLLADVADHHIARGLPAVLLLGSAFNDSDPWQQIAEQLGLTTTPPDVILGALDAAAEAAGTRAIVMVDAINERNGVAVWSARLAAFLAVADRFSHVVLLISCRTTFLPFILRDIDEKALPRLDHPGFAGKAAEAARRYLDHRGIVRMAAPHFASEFENPLFLRTCCDMLERRGERELPRGLAGVSQVFDFYFAAVVETLNHRMGLEPRLKRVEKALNALTGKMVELGTGYLSIDDAMSILEHVHPSSGRSEQNLFSQLESEGVLAVEPSYDNDILVEMVRFTFERLSDHLIAQRLLNAHVGDDDPTSAFSVGGPLAKYIRGSQSYRFAGIAEALAVQLPERYGVEILDLVDRASDRWDLIHAFEASLLWRRQEVFTDRTLALLEVWSDSIGSEAVLETLITIATEPNNRFNADHLDQWLRPLPMAERDVQWSIRAARVAEDQEGPIATVIEWVLANGLERIDPVRARLTALLLSWLTSLSHRWVRDMSTKALAVLLVDRRDLATSLIGHFSDVDDAYVVDRVLAAAYGAATRRSSDDGLPELARATFNAVFARAQLPAHALIRDHARGIIELAASRGVLPADVSLARVRPPYPGGTPLETISDETIALYVQNYGSAILRDQIVSSAVEDGDFARYEIDPLAGHFLRLPIDEYGRSPQEIYEAWYEEAVASDPGRVTALGRAIECSERSHSSPDDFEADDGHADIDEWLRIRRSAEIEYESTIREFEKLLDDMELKQFRIRAAGYIRGQMWDKDAPTWHPNYAHDSSRRWIAWRAHELGWTPSRFAAFDREMVSLGRMEHRIERIGKKYQWIAYHELAGRLSDIALIEGSARRSPELYRGPWQVGAREMDPTILVTETKQRDSDRQSAAWWSPHSSSWRDDPPKARLAWMEDQSRDIPDPIRQIDVTDERGRRWLVLNTNVGRNHLVMVDGEREIHRVTWHKIRSMLVARNASARLERLLRTSEQDRKFQPELEIRHNGYLGEYPWREAFANVDGSFTVGALRPIAIQATTADWHVERSGHDFSVADSFNLTIPAPALMRGLNLRLADGRSLAYANPNGEILFKDPSADEPGFSAAVVDYRAMQAFLDAERLDIFWIITGEKSAHGGRRHGKGWGGMHEYWGVYRLNLGSVEGQLNLVLTRPSREQLHEFLANP